MSQRTIPESRATLNEWPGWTSTDAVQKSGPGNSLGRVVGVPSLWCGGDLVEFFNSTGWAFYVHL